MRKAGNSINFIDKAIVFDFDGVILDTDKYLYDSFSSVRKHFRLKKITKQQFRREFEKNPKYIFKCEKPMLRLPFFIRLVSELKKNSDSIKLSTGFEELIKDLFSDFALFICSKNLGFIINRVLKNHNLDVYFRNIFSSGFLYHKGAVLKKISKHYGSLDVLFITDTQNDIKEAKKVNVKTIAVSFGLSSIEQLKKAKPYKIATTLKQLKSYIYQFKTL